MSNDESVPSALYVVLTLLIRVHSWLDLLSLFSTGFAGRSSQKSSNLILTTNDRMETNVVGRLCQTPTNAENHGVETRSLPGSLAATLTAFPSVSLLPAAPLHE